MIALLITVLAILVICGLIALIFHYSPLPEPFKSVAIWVCVAAAVIWFLYAVFDGWRIHIPRLT